MSSVRISRAGFWGLLTILIFSLVLFEPFGTEAANKKTKPEKRSVVSKKAKKRIKKKNIKKAKAGKAEKQAPGPFGIEKTGYLNNPYSFFEFDGKMCTVDLVYGISCLEGNKPLKPVDIDEDFRLPAAAVAWKSKLYICDYRNNRLVVYDTKEGKVDRKITHELMSDPEGIGVDAKGIIYVASYGNGYILKFTPEGEYAGKLDYKFVHPHGIYFHKGLLYVTELQGDKRVVVLDHEGRAVKEFGNSGPSRLRYPTGIWVDGNDILISDSETHSIKIYDVKTYGLKEEIGGGISFSEEGLYYPYAVARKGARTYIADTHNHRIKVLGPDGKVARMIIGERFYTPETLGTLGKKDPNDKYRIDTGRAPIFTSRVPEVKVSRDRASFSIGDTAYNGYEYVWNVKKLHDDIYVAAIESGTLQLIDKGQDNTFALNLNSFQFDPLEPVIGYAYRFQDGAYNGDGIYIANTLPGNILKVDPATGSIEEIITLRKGGGPEREEDIKNRPIFRPIRIEYINKGRFAVLDSFGRLFIFNIGTGSVYKAKQVFKNPENLFQTENHLFVTEKGRTHVYNKDFDYFGWVGFNNAVAADGHDKTLVIYSSNKELSIPIKRLKARKGSGLEPYGSMVKTGKAGGGSKSPFLNAYDDMITEKTWDLFRFWKNQEGIVKYDFNFSWLNFRVPVEKGYGSREYIPFAAHYALLSYYDYRQKGNSSSLSEFRKHAEFILESMECDDDTCEIFNDLKLENYDGGPFLSSITQTSAAAVMMKYYELTGDKEHLEIAQKLVKVLEDKLKTVHKDRLVYRAYPEGVEKLPKTQDVFWDMIFLKECGEPCRNEFGLLKQSYASIAKDIERPFLGDPLVSEYYDEGYFLYSPYATKLYHRVIKGLMEN